MMSRILLNNAHPVLCPGKRKEGIIRLFGKYCLFRPGILQTRPLSGGILPTSGIQENLSRVQERYNKLFPQQNFSMFWKLCCYPWDEDFLNQKGVCSVEKEVHPLLKSAIQEYPDDVKELVCGSAPPEPGKYFDLVSSLSLSGGCLVRNNGDPISLRTDHFSGKYVLICCFDVPRTRYMIPGCFNYLVNLCHELYSTRDDFEMVMVARMNNLANVKEVFDHFFSGFPEFCLAVPFKDSKQRDYMCNLLNFGLREGFQSLLLNKEGIVMPPWKWGTLRYFGAEAFPFTDDIMGRIETERREMKQLKASLEKMLRRSNDSSPTIVHNINAPGEEVPISNLNHKHVGLYLCCEGTLIPELLEVYNQCREKHVDFEIVVVYLPKPLVDPKVFHKEIQGLLKKHNICSWWCLPFDNSVSLRFREFTSDYFSEFDFIDDCDKLAVVGPLVKDYLDIYGANWMRVFGIDAFPFTMEATIEMIMNKLMKFRLESLLVGTVFRGTNRNDVISGPGLRNRKIILYIGKLYESHAQDLDSELKKIVSLYHKIKSEARGSEMVYVEVGESVIEDDMYSMIQCKMPWYVCPRIGTNYTSMEELLELLGLTCGGLIGFNEDGQIYFFRNPWPRGYYDTNFGEFDSDDVYNFVVSGLEYTGL